MFNGSYCDARVGKIVSVFVKCNFFLLIYFFRKYVQNLRLAQQSAFKKKKKVEVVWRGYRDVVEPTGQEFKTSELRQRLLVALKEIMKIHNITSLPKGEEKVSFSYFINYLFNFIFIFIKK